MTVRGWNPGRPTSRPSEESPVSFGGAAARSSPATRPPATVVRQVRNPRRDMPLLMFSSSRSRWSPRKGDRETGGAAPFVRRPADRVAHPHVEREAVQGRWSVDLPDRAHQRAVVGLLLAHALPVQLRNAAKPPNDRMLDDSAPDESRLIASRLDEPAAVQVVRPPERRARHDPDHLTPRAIHFTETALSSNLLRSRASDHPRRGSPGG